MKLIIINGSCGAGKSTLAARLHAAIPFSFLLDLDAQRQFISTHRENPKRRWGALFSITKSILAESLRLDMDVIIDKMIYDSASLDELIVIGEAAGADVYELILQAEKGEIVRRAQQKRGFTDEAVFTEEEYRKFWDRIDELMSTRDSAHILDAAQSEEGVFDAALKILE
jgi:deoxyadenosine/deoxycytidine kinase